jgi:uncharacterized membrane protein YkoI
MYKCLKYLAGVKTKNAPATMISKTKNIFAYLILAGVLCLNVVTSTTYAGELRLAQNNSGATQAKLIPAQQAANLARKNTGGRVLGVKLKTGKRPFYEVRVLLNSERVKTVNVDAISGSIR